MNIHSGCAFFIRPFFYTSAMNSTKMKSSAFWLRPLSELNDEQWEALCDGCGLCCLYKIEDEDSKEVFFSCVACRLLDIKRGRCRSYRWRHQFVGDCMSLRMLKPEEFFWLPESCAYRLRYEGKPLPDWHYLLCGDRDEVHRRRRSVRHFAFSEDRADNPDPESHLLLHLDDILGD